MNTIHAETEIPHEFPITIRTRQHAYRGDVNEAGGSTDSAPDPHDYFDTALASCKALTATWYARRQKIPLERIVVDVVRDNSQERAGTYGLHVTLSYEGAELTAEHRAKLHAAVEKCPLHKLMTQTEVIITTDPLAE